MNLTGNRQESFLIFKTTKREVSCRYRRNEGIGRNHNWLNQDKPSFVEPYHPPSLHKTTTIWDGIFIDESTTPKGIILTLAKQKHSARTSRSKPGI